MSATLSPSRRPMATWPLLLLLVVVVAAISLVVWRIAAGSDSVPSEQPGTTIPTAAPLADGETFAYVVAVAGAGVVVDQAELLTGAAAREAAIADGVIGPDEDLPNDVYIRNADKSTATVPVADDARLTVLSFGSGGELVEKSMTLADLEAAFGGGEPVDEIYGLGEGGLPANVTVVDGAVTSVVQQYLP